MIKACFIVYAAAGFMMTEREGERREKEECFLF